VSAARVHALLAALGFALGFVLSASGFTDWAEVHRMLSFGYGAGGPTAAHLRLLLAFAVAVTVALALFRLFAWRDHLPPKTLRAGTVPGAIVFGAGWAIAGTCPAAAIAQLGEGKVAAVATVGGMLAGAWLHDRVRKRLGWARHSCID
jgi:uncharacterized protein